MPSPGETLICVQQRAARWVEFDVHWYRKTYAIGPTVEDLLANYLTEGQRLGRSPNVFFDEAFYLRRHPNVAKAVREGSYRSGFDHYCRDGLQMYAPHWLFSPEFYRLQLPGEPPAGAYINGYDHFLRTGCGNGLMGHPLFDPAFYSTAAAWRENAVTVTRAGAYAYFLYQIHERQLDVDTSLYFDSGWYRANHPAAARAIAAGEFLCALQHYLCNDSPTAFNPLADFSEADYLSRYPDVAEAVANGTFLNGYMHFLQSGVFELRSPSRHIDLRSYWTHNDTVRRAVRSRTVRDAFAHVLTQGRAAPPMHADSPPIQNTARALFAARARHLLPLYGRQKLDFTISGPPICSAVVVLLNGLHLALQAISSLRQNHPGDIELILVDPGSVDDVRQVERYVIGARLLQFTDDIGLVRACNVALGSATADRLLYLSSDARLATGAVAAALARLDRDPSIGAVGGKIIGSDEIVQEAGGIVWRDGSIAGYMNGAAPLAPEAGFVRDVDFCSIACLVVRTALVRCLGGLDVSIAPDRLASADLGLRIRQSGYRVVYDPSVMLHRYAAAEPVDFEDLRDKQGGQRTVLFDKHRAALRSHYAASAAALPFARAADRGHRRVLFIEDTVPLRVPGSSYLRANDIIGVMCALDYQVTVFPMEATEDDPAAIAADFPDTAEILHDHSHKDFRAFLASRPGYYDAIWVSRTANLDHIRSVLDDAALIPARTRIILDAEAVAVTQEMVRARASGQQVMESLSDALRCKFRNALRCHEVLAVSEQESRLLSSIGLPNVHVLSTMRDVAPTLQPWRKRSGLLFVGDVRGGGTPDLDALCWFVDEVLPLIEAELGHETQLTVVSDLSPWMTLERIAENSRIVLLGPVSKLTPLYDSHRVMVAPARFSAGNSYKVYEAASFGVPVVATSLLSDRMGWMDDSELLAADTDDALGFAARVVALYRSEVLWKRLRQAAMARLRRDNRRDAYAQKIRAVLPAHDSGDRGGMPLTPHGLRPDRQSSNTQPRERSSTSPDDFSAPSRAARQRPLCL